MFSKSLFTRLALIVAVSSSVAFTAAPALAQDAFGSGGQFAQNSLGATGTQSRLNYTTGSQTQHLFDGNSPTLQGATYGTIANMEALLNIIANGMEILGIAWGGPTMIWGFMHMAAGSHQAMKKVLFGAAGVTGGLATPGCINWLVASARDAALFN